MGASTTTLMTSNSVYPPRVLETLVALERHHLHRRFVSMYIVYGYQPHVGASADALLAFTAQEESQCILCANYGNPVTLHPPR